MQWFPAECGKPTYDEGKNYLSASHQRAIVSGGHRRHTLNMATSRSFWRNSDRSEKLPVVVLCLCVVVLIALLWLRPLL